MNRLEVFFQPVFLSILKQYCGHPIKYLYKLYNLDLNLQYENTVFT